MEPGRSIKHSQELSNNPYLEPKQINGNTTTLLFSLKRPEIVHQERREQVKKHSNGTLQRHPLPQVRT